ncbi:MAG: leucine-rich repeat protein [Bacteroidaceae bacterium]|nr:leucine-rich repeat protein [Bacteroidaceae bacterium]
MANYEVKDGVGIIPEGTTQIKKLGFYSCKDLTTVNIPNSVTEIGEGAFKDCI